MKSAFISLLFISGLASAQPDSTTVMRVKKAAYFFYIQSGMLLGKYPSGCTDCNPVKEATFSAATIHGVKIGKRLRVGGGLGFDAYSGWNVVPIFANASWDLFSRKDAFFLQLNYGTSLKSWKQVPYEEYGLQSSQGRVMINPAVGYRIRYHDASMALLVGYKLQMMTSYYEYPTYYWHPIQGQLIGDNNSITQDQTLNRLMVSLSIGWK